MSIENLISNYGYYAVALFACIEGEVAILTAGILASQGILFLPFVIIASFFGTWLTEQSLFFIGKLYGNSILNQFPKITAKAERIFDLIKKYDSVYIFSFRFIYGIRNISPLIIGAAGVSVKKYCILNFLAAAIWSTIIPCIGFVFSKFIKNHIHNTSTYMIIIGCFIVFISLIPYFFHLITKNKKNHKNII